MNHAKKRKLNAGDYAACERKQSYRTQGSASRAAKRKQARSGVIHTVYRCPVCFGWHHTTGGHVEAL